MNERLSLPNMSLVGTSRKVGPEGFKINEVVNRLTGYQSLPGSPIEMVVIEPDHFHTGEEKGPRGIFYLFPHGPKSVLYDPESRLPSNGQYTTRPVDEVLEGLADEGFAFFLSVSLNNIGPNGRGFRQPIDKFFRYMRTTANMFTERTGIPEKHALIVEKPVTLAEISSGIIPDIKPLIIGDYSRAINGWIRAGIAQNIAHPLKAVA